MQLRLFPLGEVVLFPGMSLPLQIFEPRYRQLVTECLEDDEPFGVVLIREGDEVGDGAIPYDIGTTARIISAATRPDGVVQIAATGERRFRINQLHHDRAYLWADADYLDDTGGEVPAPLIERVSAHLAHMARLRAAANGEFEREYEIPETHTALADAAAVEVDADPEVLQAVLGTIDVYARLEALLPLLEDAVEDEERDSASAVAQRWRGFGMAN